MEEELLHGRMIIQAMKEIFLKDLCKAKEDSYLLIKKFTLGRGINLKCMDLEN